MKLVYWHWWVIGIILGILEVFVSGTIIIWFGAAAIVVGFVALIAPGLTWEAQFTLFSVLAVLSLFAWRAYVKRHPAEVPAPTLNRRGEQMVGRRLTLQTPIVNGFGQVNVDDSRWKVRGPDLPTGTNIHVVAVEGTVLIVEADSTNQS